MHQEIGIDYYFKCRLKRLNQLRWKLGDESNRVGEQHRFTAGQLQPPRGGIECGEEPIFHKNASIGEVIQQCGFAGVGIANDGNAMQPRTLSGFRLCVTHP